MSENSDPIKYPAADLQEGGGVDPGATPPAEAQMAPKSDARQATPRRFSPTIIVVGIITAIIVVLAIAGGIAVIFDAFQFFN